MCIRDRGYTHVLAFCISSGLSGTYNTVASVLGDEKDLTSFVLDTRSISFGAGILFLRMTGSISSPDEVMMPAAPMEETGAM